VTCGVTAPMSALPNSPGYYRCDECGVWYRSHGDRGLGHAFEVAWADRGNRWCLLGEMGTSHIQNIIALMLVKPNWRERYRGIMIGELEKRLWEEDRANGAPT